jgi:hypothetical protein
MNLFVKILCSVTLLGVGFYNLSLSPGKYGLNNQSGNLTISFVHMVNGQPARYDTLVYTNSVGNRYQINLVQYFVSEIRMYKTGGEKVLLSPSTPCHYVDKDIAPTLRWNITDAIAAGAYDSISFIFGLSKEYNKSFRFKNPPENYMAWPDVLGGGYHYMKINLKYLNKTGDMSNFNCHLGIGRLKDDQGKTTGFEHNIFTVKLPVNALVITPGKPKELQVIMNIEKWFDAPNKMDFNNYGGIMDNQAAMKLFCENGLHVFSLKAVE